MPFLHTRSACNRLLPKHLQRQIVPFLRCASNTASKMARLFSAKPAVFLSVRNSDCCYSVLDIRYSPFLPSTHLVLVPERGLHPSLVFKDLLIGYIISQFAEIQLCRIDATPVTKDQLWSEKLLSLQRRGGIPMLFIGMTEWFSSVEREFSAVCGQGLGHGESLLS